MKRESRFTERLALNLTKDRFEEVKATSERYQIAPVELMRQALEIGWPRLEKRLQKKRMELHEPTTEKPVFNALGLNLTKDMNDAVKSASERYRILKSVLMRDALEIGWPQLEERLREKGEEI